MILSFPSPMQRFQVGTPVPKDAQIHYAHIVGGEELVFTSPVTLKPNDYLWIDTRNGHVEIVERCGVTIWRASWLN